jgi:hypothetical protein
MTQATPARRRDAVSTSTVANSPITRIKQRIAHGSRSRRAQLFERVFPKSDYASIVDLGGGKGTHFHNHYPSKKCVHIADYNAPDLAQAAAKFGYTPHLVDGTETLPFKDNEFDIVFCSSVIEHVTGPKQDAVDLFKADGAAFAANAWNYQMKFAKEIRRIGRGYFVQTPCRSFPVEVHSWIPMLGYLPSHLQWKVIKIFNRFWPRKNDEADWSLLAATQMQELFPDAEIHKEKFWGLTKSIIAVRRLSES